MTPKAGWIAVLVATILALLLTGIVWKSCVDQASFDIKDAASLARIEKLEEKNAVLDEDNSTLSEAALASAANAAEADTRADTAEKGRKALKGRLALANRNVEARPNPRTFEACKIALRDSRGESDMVKQALKLAETEAQERKLAYDRLGIAYAGVQSARANDALIRANDAKIKDVQAERIEGYQRQAKRTKRLAIVRGVFIGGGLLGLGIGIGAVVAK